MLSLQTRLIGPHSTKDGGSIGALCLIHIERAMPYAWSCQLLHTSCAQCSHSNNIVNMEQKQANCWQASTLWAVPVLSAFPCYTDRSSKKPHQTFSTLKYRMLIYNMLPGHIPIHHPLGTSIKNLSVWTSVDQPTTVCETLRPSRLFTNFLCLWEGESSIKCSYWSLCSAQSPP